MRIVTGIVFLFIALLPYAAMLGQRADSEATGPGPREILTIISPHRREVRLEYSRGFARWMKANYGRTVEVQWLDVGGTSKILKDLESRYAAHPDRPGADLLFGGGIPAFQTCMDHGWLTPVTIDSAILNPIPPTCAGTAVYDRSNYWFGVALSGFGILYNRPVVERMHLPTPRSWDDLARPEFFTWVASGDPRSSGSIHMCYEIILQAYGYVDGWSRIVRISANVRNFGEAGGTGPREVAAGEVAAGLVIDQYAKTVMDAVGDGKLAFVLPQNATVINPDPIGLLRGAAQQELAGFFMRFVLLPEGQKLLCRPAGQDGQKYSLYRMPVLPMVYKERFAPPNNPYQFESDFTFDNAKSNRRRAIVDDLIGVCLIEAHPGLTRAWRQIIVQGCPADKVQELCRPPVSEAEMEQLIPRWNDERFRTDTKRRWIQEAQARYAGLCEP